MQILILENGPILIEGPLEIGGKVIEQQTVALCRCGASKNKPFCDGGHRAAGFVAVERLLKSVEDKE